MSLRWYSTVIDCRDVVSQARWWAEALGWRVIYETTEEAVAVPQWVTADRVPWSDWDRQLPGLVFVPVPEPKTVKNRLHIDLACHTEDDREAEIRRLIQLGATPADVGQGVDKTWTVLRDPEGNEFCVLSSRDR
jgi:hypothetical protein